VAEGRVWALAFQRLAFQRLAFQRLASGMPPSSGPRAHLSTVSHACGSRASVNLRMPAIRATQGFARVQPVVLPAAAASLISILARISTVRNRILGLPPNYFCRDAGAGVGTAVSVYEIVDP
jgi:hypothetical protein